MRIRIHFFSNCGSGSISGSSSGSRVLMTKNFKKLELENFFYICLQKIVIYLSLDLHKERASYRRRLRSSKGNIHSKHENSLLFSLFVGHFCPPGSESTTLLFLPSYIRCWRAWWWAWSWALPAPCCGMSWNATSRPSTGATTSRGQSAGPVLKGTVSRDWIRPSVVLLLDKLVKILLPRRILDFLVSPLFLNSNKHSRSVLAKN